MSDYDPFAAAPADEAQAAPAEPAQESVFDAPPAEAPAKAPAKKAPAKKAAVTVDVKPNILPASEGKVVLTFKGGSGFDAPWVVIHANDLQDAYESVSGENAALLAALMERVQIAGQHFSKLGGGKPAQAAPARQAAPKPAQEPPAGAPAKPGEGWEFRTGVSKSTGKPWQAWMPPRGSQDKPVFF